MTTDGKVQEDARVDLLVMGAQYSIGIPKPEWKAWLEERGSLEKLRSIYQDFRSMKGDAKGSDDAFFITMENFRQVQQQIAEKI